MLRPGSLVGTEVSEEHRFLQEPHGVTSQKTAFFRIEKSRVYTALNYAFLVRFEVFTAVTMKNGVFWVVTPCGSCATRRNNPEDTILYAFFV
jgi:hypothetical protein